MRSVACQLSRQRLQEGAPKGQKTEGKCSKPASLIFRCQKFEFKITAHAKSLHASGAAERFGG